MFYPHYSATLTPDDLDLIRVMIAHSTTENRRKIAQTYRERASRVWAREGGTALHRRTCAMADAIEDRLGGESVDAEGQTVDVERLEPRP